MDGQSKNLRHLPVTDMDHWGLCLWPFVSTRLDVRNSNSTITAFSRISSSYIKYQDCHQAWTNEKTDVSIRCRIMLMENLWTERGLLIAHLALWKISLVIRCHVRTALIPYIWWQETNPHPPLQAWVFQPQYLLFEPSILYHDRLYHTAHKARHHLSVQHRRRRFCTWSHISPVEWRTIVRA
jgi:hypothetical protein